MAEELTPDICVIGGGPGGIAVALGGRRPGRSRRAGRKGADGRQPISLRARSRRRRFLPPPATTRSSVAGRPSASAARRFRSISPRSATMSLRSIDAVATNVSAERLDRARRPRHRRRRPFRRPRGRSSPATRPSAPAASSSPRGPVPRCRRLPGLDDVDYLTADAGLRPRPEAEPPHRPRRRAHAASRLAQAYNRLGIDATVIDEATALADDDPELVRDRPRPSARRRASASATA